MVKAGRCWILAACLLAAAPWPAAGAEDDPCLRALAQGAPQVAVQACGQMIQARQGSPADAGDLAALLHNRALAWLAMGEVDQALADLDQALLLSPGDGWLLNSRAAARARRGDLEPALADLERAARLLPAEPLPRLNLGRLRLARGENELALAEMDRVLVLRPDNDQVGPLRRLALGGAPPALAEDASALAARALAHKKQGRYGQALADYRRALELEPALAPALNGMAWLLATCPEDRWRDGGRALELARRALAQRQDPARLDTLAAALAECGRLEEAGRAQAKALALLGKSPAPRLAGEYRRRLKSYQEGRPWRDQP